MRSDLQLSTIKFTRWPTPLHHHEMPVAFLWTPKAGCTSLVKWFFFQIGELDAALSYNPFVHRYRKDVFMKRDGYLREGLDLIVAGDVPVIKLVRDPYDRAVSSFAQLLKLQGAAGSEWPRKLRAGILDKIGETAPPDCLSFHQFLRGMAAIGAASASLSRHVAQQYQEGEEQLRDRLIRLENFDAEITVLEREFTLKPSPLAELTAAGHHRRKVPAPAGSLAGRMMSSADFPAAATPSYDAFYDDETQRLAAAIFAADFRAYSYPA
jgi:hypothetical protein